MRVRAVRLLVAATALVAITLSAPGLASAASAAGPVTTPTTFRQKVPVNVVLVGFPDEMAKSQELIGGLPKTYTPVVRQPKFYGLPGRDLGLEYTFDYRIRSAGKGFANDFFRYLRQTGTPGPLTSFQQNYNDQRGNLRDVTGPVLYNDAPATEKWLEKRAASSLGIDGRRSYTVFLVNWFSRPDFRFHVYTKTDTTDVDTGYNFGAGRDSRKLIAWGGSSGRSWFYDFSAGPDAFTKNWNVDDADIDNDSTPDYRIPPAWEYSPQGYRAPAALPADMARLIRYVGINLLFTTSPLYDPLASSPDRGGRKVLDVSMLEDDADPAVTGRDFYDPGYVRKALSAFQPYYRWKVTTTDYDPIDAKAERAHRIWAGLVTEDDCWKDLGNTFAQLFCYFNGNRDAYGKPARPRDYRAGAFVFNTTEARMGNQFPLLGYADDNWADGTPSYVFAWDTPEIRDLGFGFSTTVSHEFGHHIGMSHPHDGYDSEQAIDYGTTGAFTYSWAGDESDTLMSYAALSNYFGLFDRDNMGRWQFAGNLNEAAGTAAAVVASPRANRVAALLATYSSQRAKAVAAFGRWDFRTAATAARAANEAATAAATRLGVQAATPPAAATRSATMLPERNEAPRPHLTD